MFSRDPTPSPSRYIINSINIEKLSVQNKNSYLTRKEGCVGLSLHAVSLDQKIISLLLQSLKLPAASAAVDTVERRRSVRVGANQDMTGEPSV